MTSLRTLLYTLCALSLTSAAVAGHHDEARDIVDTAADAGNFNTLIAAAKAAGLAGALKGDGPLTVFAPSDEAFSALPSGTIASLLKPENKAQLAGILKYHVVAGKVGSDALADGARIDTLAGVTALISQTEGGFNIENARIIATDIDASNGVIHVIDRVILPPTTMSRRDAVQRIQMAIDRGVPMFNHGNTKGTVAVYMAAVDDLLLLGDLTTEEQMRLELGRNDAQAARSSTAGAWELRYALDAVHDSLRDTAPMAMAR